jgi:hypothetical protein
MASQSENTVSRWRRLLVTGLAGAGLAVGMALGGAATANADILDDLEEQYGRGAGGGQIANLLDDALVMRSQGVRPKPADLQAVAASLEYRPNQQPLVEALQQVVASQRKALSHAGQQPGPGGGAGFSINQGPWQSNPGGNPMIQDSPIFPMPGRW